MERSDEPNLREMYGADSFERWQAYDEAAWFAIHPCPEANGPGCPRCGVDYATYLALEALLREADA